MRFSYEGKEIKLQGENILAPIPLKSKNLNKMIVVDSISGFYQMQVVRELGNEEHS